MDKFRRLILGLALAAVPGLAQARCSSLGGTPFNCTPGNAPTLNDYVLGGSNTPPQAGQSVRWTWSQVKPLMGGTTLPLASLGQLYGGSGAAGTASVVTIGSGLNLSGGVLSASGGSGTVTSVGLTAPGIFSVGGSPITGAGTLVITLVNQSANLVWAGPGSGSAAGPTFRSLVTADIPAPGGDLGGTYASATVLNIGHVTSGVLPVANGGFGSSSGTSGGIPAYSASGVISSTAILAASRIVVGGGAGSVPHTVTTGGSSTNTLHGGVGDPTWSQVNLATDVTGVLPSGSTGIEIDLFYSGVPPNNAFLMKSFSRSTVIAASAPIKCSAKTGATASTTVLLYHVVSGTPTGVGTLVFAASGSAYQGCTVTWTGSITFAAGDVLEADFPSTADATLANIAISVPATQ